MKIINGKKRSLSWFTRESLNVHETRDKANSNLRLGGVSLFHTLFEPLRVCVSLIFILFFFLYCCFSQLNFTRFGRQWVKDKPFVCILFWMASSTASAFVSNLGEVCILKKKKRKKKDLVKTSDQFLLSLLHNIF